MLKKLRKLLKQQEGFTLVELMIVVVILGIIAGLGVQQYNNVQEKAKEGVDEANKKMILSAVRLYELAEGTLPEEIAQLKGYGLDFEGNEFLNPWNKAYDLDIDTTSRKVTVISPRE